MSAAPRERPDQGRGGMYGDQSLVSRGPRESTRDGRVRALDDTVANLVGFYPPTPRIRSPHERELGEMASDC